MASVFANAQIHEYSLKLAVGSGHKYCLLLTAYCLLLTVPSFSQDAKTKQLYDQSMKLFSERKANEAITFMQEAIKREPSFADAHLKLGQLYEFTRRVEPALVAYREGVRLQPDAPATAPAYQSLSNLLLKLGRYAEAIPNLEKYATFFAPQSPQAQRVERMLITARFGLEALQHPQNVTPKPVSPALQTTPSQYFPVLTADEQTMVFTVLKPEGDEDLFTTTFNGEIWQPPVSLSPNINTPENEGTPSLSADGRTLVFTACQGRKGFGSCDLYITRRTGIEWSEPQNLGPNVNTRHYESQPALSADGRRLYFVSDRPGGRGRRDIWRTNADADGNWQEPINLGAPINTALNEASPFIHANGQTLFFASEGHPGMGGYDLFVSDSTQTSSSQRWSSPTNLGYPINTSEDQASLFVSANGVRGYYSFEEQKDGVSQRSRVYVFDMPESLRERVKPVSYLKGVITNGKSNIPLSATIELIDLATNQTVSRVTSDTQTGQYAIVLPTEGEYALYVNSPGYLFKSLSFDFTQKNKEGNRGVVLPVLLEPISATSRETLNNLFFESGRYDVAGKSRTELGRLAQFMKANPTVSVEISGHTDDQGDATANLALSKKRAQAVVAYLTEAGIDATRIRATGFGKTRPLFPNTSDENRRLNRRIEWRVL
ncbi:MAG: flagellar motor protein MotB [Cytophagales bacterium]|nr:MAG: flagellar motor protein MotB [Cytophagales bacterium]